MQKQLIQSSLLFLHQYTTNITKIQPSQNFQNTPHINTNDITKIASDFIFSLFLRETELKP